MSFLQSLIDEKSDLKAKEQFIEKMHQKSGVEAQVISEIYNEGEAEGGIIAAKLKVFSVLENRKDIKVRKVTPKHGHSVVHRDKKKAMKRGDVKHKPNTLELEMDRMATENDAQLYAIWDTKNNFWVNKPSINLRRQRKSAEK